jgi:outer membrane protein assembly factor BamE (lipoprotein component of BamABCDE complex)
MRNRDTENADNFIPGREGFYKEATNPGTKGSVPGFMASLFNRFGWRLRHAASLRFHPQLSFAFARIRQLSAVVILVTALCLLSGCVTPGENLDRSAVAKLQQGQTRDEVRKVFGPPQREEAGGSGKSLDFYQVNFVRGNNAPLRAMIVRTLSVLYDKAGRVERFKHHVGELPIILTRMGWEAGAELDEARVREIERETNNRFQLEAMFGSPTVEWLNCEGEEVMSWCFITGTRGFYRSGHELLVNFDSANRVKDYIYRKSTRDIRSLVVRD